MGKAKRSDEEQSLIPSIQEKEKALRQMLEQARSAADTAVGGAEREAARRLEETREQIPGRMERRFQEAAARFEAEAAERQKAAEEENKRLADAAAGHLEAAVSAIVAAVWPEGDA
jgi:vacuolar-type H+-ATPase subunit H